MEFDDIVKIVDQVKGLEARLALAEAERDKWQAAAAKSMADTERLRWVEENKPTIFWDWSRQLWVVLCIVNGRSIKETVGPDRSATIDSARGVK